MMLPATFTSGHTYNTNRYMWIYTPEECSGSTESYPLIIGLLGDGARSTNQQDVIKGIDDIVNEGIGWFLSKGDKPPKIYMALVQIPSSDYTATIFDQVKAKMVLNYKVNTNRIYVTGLSRGAFGCRVMAQNRASEIAAVLGISGNYGSGWNWSGITGNGQSNVQHLWLHGTVDVPVAISLASFLNSANAASFNMNQCFETMAFWNKGHEGFVWNTNCYNRKERTDAPGTAIFDYVRYLKRFSKDKTEQATLHVINAEETLEIIDWRQARMQVDSLATGLSKTDLLSRLAIVKVTIDAGGKRYIIDQGTTALPPTGSSIVVVNNMTSHILNATLSNLKDDENGTSTKGFKITTPFAPSARETTIARNRGKYFGLDRSFNNDSMTINYTVTGGTCKFFGLDNNKLYDLRIYHVMANGSFTQNATINVCISGVTKTQYSECNNTQFVEYLALAPVNGEIVIKIKCDADKSTCVTGFELFEPA